MVETHAAEAAPRLSGARADFVASIGRRLDALRGSMAALEREPRSRARRDGVLRRLHAMGAGARVLGFAGVAEALAMAEAALQRSSGGREVRVADLAEVSRAIDLLPTLVWGAAPPSMLPQSRIESAAAEDRAWPLSVLVFGSSPLADGLIEHSTLDGVEVEITDDLDNARELGRIVGPDVVLIDADRRGARELANAVLHDPLMEPAPLVVVGTFETPEAASNLVALGAARVLPKPVSPDTLRRTVLELGRMPAARSVREPIGDVNVEQLTERISAEVRRGLVEAVDGSGREVPIALADGTDVLAAVWAAVARVRELVTLHSEGAVRFEASGPEGAIPLAPWTGSERRAGERGPHDARDAEGVSLESRRVLIADDDPAVVWFLGGLIRAARGEPLEAHDGTRALDLACQSWPDVVVSDVLMPGLDGFSLCREIKRDVAVRDVPVILLSWKEDLLHRVRELGAGADGYLRKEATGSTVVQRLREVLRPRARVEARLAAGGEVRGRLDGLTPRLILQLACAKQANCRIAVRDAVYLYEVQVREGRPYCATRTASDGSFERGEAVLGALLGASAGRFVVTPDKTRCRQDFEGTLEKVLAGPIRRARVAQRAVSADTLMDIERVEIDEAALAGYLAATPDPVRGLVERLAEGASPRQLLLGGETSPRLLEVVLSDVARHAGIVRVESADGADLLELAARELNRPRPAAEPARPAPSPTPMLNFETPAAALEPPPAAPGGAAPAAEPPPSLPSGPTSAVAPVSPAPSSAAPVSAEPTTLPGMGTAKAVESKAKAAPAPVERPPTAKSAAVAVLPKPVSPSPSPVAPRLAKPVTKAESSSPGGAPIAKPSPRVESSSTASLKKAEPTETPDGDVDIAEAIAQIVSPEPAPVLPQIELPPKAQPARDVASGPPLNDTLPLADFDRTSPKPLVAAAVPPVVGPAAVEPSPSAGATPSPELTPAPPPIDEGGSVAASLPTTAESTAPRAIARPVSAAESHAAPPSETVPRAPIEGRVSAVKLVLLTLAAAGLSFLVVRTFFISSATGTRAPEAAAPSPSASAPRTARLPVVEDLDLPDGVPVPESSGLLEIEAQQNDGIYVDDAFVGRGPTRRIPLLPGPHAVRIQLETDAVNTTVDVKKGRRVRLAFGTGG